MTARMLAIYGKGGIGKSFTTSNLTARMAFDGARVLQLGWRSQTRFLQHHFWRSLLADVGRCVARS